MLCSFLTGLSAYPTAGEIAGNDPESFSVERSASQSAQVEVVRTCGPSVVTVRTDEASGSGFIVLDGKHVATCYHVIEGAKKITVETNKGIKFEVDSVYVEQRRDIAILHLADDSHLTPIALADLDPLSVGETVIVIGNSLGILPQSVTTGTFSGNRKDRNDTILVQFSAPISPGNSGAPILSANKKAIGVVSFNLTEGQNLNMGISAVHIREALAGKPRPLADILGATKNHEKGSHGDPMTGAEALHSKEQKQDTYAKFASEVLKAFLLAIYDVSETFTGTSYPSRWREGRGACERYERRIGDAINALLLSDSFNSKDTFPKDAAKRVDLLSEVMRAYFSQLQKVLIDIDNRAPTSHYDNDFEKFTGESKRADEAFNDLFQATRTESWFDESKFLTKITPLWFSTCVSVYGLDVDPAFEHMCVASDQLTRKVPKGSKITGLRTAEGESFTDVQNWRDVSRYLELHKNPRKIVIRVKDGSQYLLERK